MLLSCTCHAFVMLMILVVHTASGGVKAATAMHPGGGSESSSERGKASHWIQTNSCPLAYLAPLIPSRGRATGPPVRRTCGQQLTEEPGTSSIVQQG